MLAAPVKADGLGVAGAMVDPLDGETGPVDTAVGPWICPSLIWLTGATVGAEVATVTWPSVCCPAREVATVT